MDPELALSGVSDSGHLCAGTVLVPYRQRHQILELLGFLANASGTHSLI